MLTAQVYGITPLKLSPAASIKQPFPQDPGRQGHVPDDGRIRRVPGMIRDRVRAGLARPFDERFGQW